MLLRRPTLLATTVACALLALPAIASAKDYCSGFPGCTGTYVDDGEVSSALTQAESNGSDDRIFLGPGVYIFGPFGYQSSERIEIIGAGAGQTVLQGDAAGAVLTLGGNPDSSVRDLTIKPVGGAAAGLTLTGTRAQAVAVDATAAPSLLAGVSASGGASFDDGSVDVGSSLMPDVLLLGSSATVTDSRLTAPKGYGVLASGSEATVRRSTLDAKYGATASAGHLTVSDTLVDLRGKGSNATGAAIGVSAGPDGAATTVEADLDRLTVVGSTPNTVETIGVSAGANGAGKGATIRLRDSVISGIGIPLGRQGINGATVNLSTDRSLYPQPVYALDGGPGSLVEEYHLTANPGFVDEPGGDFHLAAGSPLIDAGTPGALPPAPPTATATRVPETATATARPSPTSAPSSGRERASTPLAPRPPARLPPPARPHLPSAPRPPRRPRLCSRA